MTRLARLSLMFATTLCLLLSCSRAQELPAGGPPRPGGRKVLVVYLSRTGNTAAIAGMIRDRIGGALAELELETPYPADYAAAVRQVAEENETGYAPPLKTRIDRIEQYDVVFLGFPTWGMHLPPPMRSFLGRNDLSGKTVVPFNTNAGYGEGDSFRTVRELCPRGTVLEGFVTRGGVERDGLLLAVEGARAEEVRRDVERWLLRIGMLP